MEDVVSMIFKHFRFRDGTTLIEVTPLATPGTAISSAQPQQCPEAQEPSDPLNQPEESVDDTQVSLSQDQYRLPLPLEDSHPSHHPHVSPQSDAKSAWEELAGIQDNQDQGYSKLEQVFAGQYGSAESMATDTQAMTLTSKQASSPPRLRTGSLIFQTHCLATMMMMMTTTMTTAAVSGALGR